MVALSPLLTAALSTLVARPLSDQLIVWPWIAYLVLIVSFTTVAMRIAGHRDLGLRGWPG